MRAGPLTMSHIDSANQEVCAQLLCLCYSVSTLRRLPTYVRSTFMLRKILFGCYCMSIVVLHWYGFLLIVQYADTD